MRRFALFLLLLALPLQYSLAAVGAYCQHEGSEAQWHFGHHVHKHEQGDQKSGAPIKHADCATCHHGVAGMTDVVASVLAHRVSGTLVPFDPQLMLIDVSSEPERPNWTAAG